MESVELLVYIQARKIYVAFFGAVGILAFSARLGVLLSI
jgi:hypothetical protein